MTDDVPDRVALIVVDVQRAFDDPAWGKRNNPDAEANVARLLRGWREAGQPVIHVRHHSRSETGTFRGAGIDPKPEAVETAGEPVIEKDVNSAFIGTDLEQRLRADHIGEVVICGLTTDHCVSTTARMAGNLGFGTVVVSDATATFERRGPDGRSWSAADMHDTALASLDEEFAAVLPTSEALDRVR